MNSKRKRFSSGSSIHDDINKTLEDGQSQVGTFNTDWLNLSDLEIDPKNPRWAETNLTVDDVLKSTPETLNEDDPNYGFLKGLHELAQSIRVVGIEQPLKVYRWREKYRVLHGNRRTLAGLLANTTKAPCWILAEEPKNKRHLQFMENLQREDLEPYQLLLNIEGLIGESFEGGLNAISVDNLSKLIGKSHGQSGYYLAILSEKERIALSALAEKAVTSIEKAVIIARADSIAVRKKMVAAAKKGASVAELKSLSNSAPTKQGAKNKPAKTKKWIPLGRISKPTVARNIIEKVLGDDTSALGSVNWDDPESVKKAWVAFIKHVEKDLS